MDDDVAVLCFNVKLLQFCFQFDKSVLEFVVESGWMTRNTVRSTGIFKVYGMYTITESNLH